MGIKGLNVWLRNIKQTNVDISSIKVDTLFIDGQQILHPILSDLTEKEKYLDQCETVINTFQPSEYIFLAMDGPNPAAKFQTQRRNRFQEAVNEMKTNCNYQYPNEELCNVEFEKFMNSESIDHVLKQFLQNVSQNDNCTTKQIFYSSRYAAGEAEHKYLDFFRKQKKSPGWKPNQNHFIFSNDNDLMFLSLQFTDENFYVVKFKFDEQNNLKDDIIDIQSVRKYLLSQIYNNKIKRTPQFEERIIKDIIGLSFILGNDFIPEFEDINQNKYAFNGFIIAYSKINMKSNINNYNYLIENDSFNVSTFKKIVSTFFSFKNNKQNVMMIQPQNNQDKKQKKAQELLRIFNFTYLYYTRGVPSWTYYYPYDDSINLQELVQLMKQEGKEFFVNIEDKEETTPFLKALVTHSSFETFGLPWNVFKIKMIPEIANEYWPHNLLPPIHDLQKIKTYFKEAI